MRRETGGHTATLLWGVASRICSNQHVAFLCTSHLAFFLSISLESRWCIHAFVLHGYTLENFPFYYSRENRFPYDRQPANISTHLPDVYAFSRWDIAAEVYELVFKFLRLAVSYGDSSILFKTMSLAASFRLSSRVSAWAGVYLGEVLGHLHSLRQSEL